MREICESDDEENTAFSHFALITHDYHKSMNNYQRVGPFFSPNAKHYLREIGGLSVVDDINADLILLPERNGHNISLGGLDFTFIGRGSDRAVYRHRNIVLKLQTTEIKRWGNVTEWTVYQEAYKMGIHRHFAATVALLTGWRYGAVILQEYVSSNRTYTYEEARKFDNQYNRILDKAENNTLVIRAWDIHHMNKIGNKVIDYGRFTHKSEPALEERVNEIYRESFPHL